jgi:hypothetical protein
LNQSLLQIYFQFATPLTLLPVPTTKATTQEASTMTTFFYEVSLV